MGNVGQDEEKPLFERVGFWKIFLIWLGVTLCSVFMFGGLIVSGVLLIEALELIVTLALFWIYWQIVSKDRFGTAAMFGRSPSFLSIAVLIFLAMFLQVVAEVGVMFQQYLWPGSIEARAIEYVLNFEVAEDRLPTILNIISINIGAPIVEELIFRGLLLSILVRRWGVWPGLMLSSLLFGVSHADFVAATIDGLVLGWVYLKARSLWAPIVLHFAYNAIYTTLVFVGLGDTWFLPQLSQSICVVILIALFIGFYLLVTKSGVTQNKYLPYEVNMKYLRRQ